MGRRRCDSRSGWFAAISVHRANKATREAGESVARSEAHLVEIRVFGDRGSEEVPDRTTCLSAQIIYAGIPIVVAVHTVWTGCVVPDHTRQIGSFQP